MIAAAVPEKVIVVSALPSPVVKLRPAVPASVSVPRPTARVTLSSALSGSLTERPATGTEAASSLVATAPPVTLTGPSLVSATLTVAVAGSLSIRPSKTVKEMVREVLAPKFVGLSPALAKVTESSIA